MSRKLYQEIASRLQARMNCAKTGNTEWHDKHEQAIIDLCKNAMPSGSGFDSGTAFDFDASTPNKLVFHTEYHHMSEGYYDGWTEHSIIVRPSLQFGFDLRITGPNRNDFKEYAHDVFSNALDQDVA